MENEKVSILNEVKNGVSDVFLLDFHDMVPMNYVFLALSENNLDNKRSYLN